MALYFAFAEDQAKICCLGGRIAFCLTAQESKSCWVIQKLLGPVGQRDLML
jgi:hypothetical protein